MYKSQIITKQNHSQTMLKIKTMKLYLIIEYLCGADEHTLLHVYGVGSKRPGDLRRGYFQHECSIHMQHVQILCCEMPLIQALIHNT